MEYKRILMLSCVFCMVLCQILPIAAVDIHVSLKKDYDTNKTVYLNSTGIYYINASFWKTNDNLKIIATNLIIRYVTHEGKQKYQSFTFLLTPLEPKVNIFIYEPEGINDPRYETYIAVLNYEQCIIDNLHKAYTLEHLASYTKIII